MPHSKGSGTKGTNFVHIVHMECKKATCTAFKNANKRQQHGHWSDDSDSVSNGSL